MEAEGAEARGLQHYQTGCGIAGGYKREQTRRQAGPSSRGVAVFTRAGCGLTRPWPSYRRWWCCDVVGGVYRARRTSLARGSSVALLFCCSTKYSGVECLLSRPPTHLLCHLSTHPPIHLDYCCCCPPSTHHQSILTIAATTTTTTPALPPPASRRSTPGRRTAASTAAALGAAKGTWAGRAAARRRGPQRGGWPGRR